MRTSKPKEHKEPKNIGNSHLQLTANNDWQKQGKHKGYTQDQNTPGNNKTNLQGRLQKTVHGTRNGKYNKSPDKTKGTYSVTTTLLGLLFIGY